jgi:hypothetical protein
MRTGWLEVVTPAVLAVFVAAVSAPRTGVVVHHHHDGDRPHVHLDGDTDASDDEHDDHPPLAPGEVALAAPDGPGSWHAHAASPFQCARSTPAPRAVRVDRIRFVAPRPTMSVSLGSRIVASARGPPSFTRC